MATTLQILENDAFSMTSLSEAVRKMPFKERMLGSMSLFDPVFLETDTVTIDEEDHTLQIYSTANRGAAAERNEKNPNRVARAFTVPHIPVEERILASTLLGKRRTGQTELESIAEKINSQMMMMRERMEDTFEIHRLGALKGEVKDADGSTLLDIYSAFGKTQTEVDFVMSSSTTDLRNTTVDAKRELEDALGGVGMSGCQILAGKTWFSDFVAHETVKDSYRYQQGQQNRSDLRDGFAFAGCEIAEYRGFTGLANEIGEINDDEAYMFPTGVSGMFRANYAPGDFLETVNALGEEMFARVAPDLKFNKHVDLYLESNPLFINTRPEAVIKLTKS